jgi:hypothetical protein
MPVITFPDVAPAFARAAQAMRAASAAMEQLGDCIYRTAEDAYLRQHARLPGGRSSARLRKKRRDLVLRWFFGKGST